MIRVGLKTTSPSFPWFRQTPGGNGIWDKYLFTSDCSQVDFLVVYDDVLQPFETNVPVESRLLIIGEPIGIKKYPRRFLRQFGAIICPYELDNYDGNCIKSQAGLPWFYGISFENNELKSKLNFDELCNHKIQYNKLDKVSVICSTKVKLAKHRSRLKFIEFLKDRLGERLVIGGRGFLDINDKAELIDPYKYHLVLENNDVGLHWTEKLADAFLGYGLPFFSGSSNATQDFPDGSIIPIDINDAYSCLSVIESTLELDLYSSRINALSEARQKILFEHNVFALVARYLDHYFHKSALHRRIPAFNTVYQVDLRDSELKRVIKTIRRVTQKYRR